VRIRLNRVPSLLTYASLFVVATVVLSFGCAQEIPTLTVVSFGGPYQAAQSKAYMQPFSTSSGIKIVEGDYNGEYGLLKQRAEANDGAWDVVSVESAPTARGTREGIFLAIPDSVYAGLNLLPEARQSHAAGHLVFSTVLAYDSQVLKGNTPTSWADFWDLKKFPGKRGLRNNPRGTLEIALLASGVDAAQLYPLDVERALAALDKIRSSVVFWESGAQPTQLLGNKTVAMTSIYNGRAWNAKTKDGLPIDWSWNQGLMETEYWAVPKNTKHCSRGDEVFWLLPFAPSSSRCLQTRLPTVRPIWRRCASSGQKSCRLLPNSEKALPFQIPVNSAWWAENEARVGALWEKMAKRTVNSPGLVGWLALTGVLFDDSPFRPRHRFQSLFRRRFKAAARVGLGVGFLASLSSPVEVCSLRPFQRWRWATACVCLSGFSWLFQTIPTFLSPVASHSIVHQSGVFRVWLHGAAGTNGPVLGRSDWRRCTSSYPSSGS
jgi:putative spermidine/putrescine transport system substrate-binding protein